MPRHPSDVLDLPASRRPACSSQYQTLHFQVRCHLDTQSLAPGTCACAGLVQASEAGRQKTFVVSEIDLSDCSAHSGCCSMSSAKGLAAAQTLPFEQGPRMCSKEDSSPNNEASGPGVCGSDPHKPSLASKSESKPYL